MIPFFWRHKFVRLFCHHRVMAISIESKKQNKIHDMVSEAQSTDIILHILLALFTSQRYAVWVWLLTALLPSPPTSHSFSSHKTCNFYPITVVCFSHYCEHIDKCPCFVVIAAVTLFPPNESLACKVVLIQNREHFLPSLFGTMDRLLVFTAFRFLGSQLFSVPWLVCNTLSWLW